MTKRVSPMVLELEVFTITIIAVIKSYTKTIDRRTLKA